MADMHATSGLQYSEGLIDELSEDKEARDVYVADQVRVRLALMIRALREQPDRKWTQAELGQKMSKTQSVVSRIEDPDYGKLTLQTLFEVAAAFDLPLWIDLPEWDEWLARSQDMSAAKLHRVSFNAEKIKSSNLCSKHNNLIEMQSAKNIYNTTTLDDLLARLGLKSGPQLVGNQNPSAPLIQTGFGQNSKQSIIGSSSNPFAFADVSLLNNWGQHETH